NCTRVEDAGFDSDGGADAGHCHWNDGAAPRWLDARARGRQNGGPGAQLSPRVVSPAADGAVLEGSAGVPAAGGNGSGRGDSADSDRARVESGALEPILGQEAGIAGSVTELAEGVLPPALHGTVPGKRACVEPAGRGRGSASDSGDSHRSGGLETDGLVAELVVVVSSPALERPVGKASHRGKPASRDSGRTGDSDNRYRRRRIGRGSVAELT